MWLEPKTAESAFQSSYSGHDQREALWKKFIRFKYSSANEMVSKLNKKSDPTENIIKRNSDQKYQSEAEAKRTGVEKIIWYFQGQTPKKSLLISETNKRRDLKPSGVSHAVPLVRGKNDILHLSSLLSSNLKLEFGSKILKWDLKQRLLF